MSMIHAGVSLLWERELLSKSVSKRRLGILCRSLSGRDNGCYRVEERRWRATLDVGSSTNALGEVRRCRTLISDFNGIAAAGLVTVNMTLTRYSYTQYVETNKTTLRQRHARLQTTSRR